MSAWKDEADFMHDVESISAFFVPGEHNNPANKFVFKTNKKKNTTSTAWYESDSDDSVDYSFGRGRNTKESVKNPGEEPNHLDVMREIQMQVRNAVGNRYNNEVIESYYNVSNDIPTCESPTAAPKEVSITYAKEKNSQKGSPVTHDSPVKKKLNVAENISQAAAKLSIGSQVSSASSSSSTNSSPKKGRHNNRRKFGNKSNYRPGIGRGQSQPESSFPFGSAKRDSVNVNSKDEFPPL